MLALGFRLSPIRIIYAPILGVFHALGTAPIIAINWSGQPAPLSGGFPLLLTANLGTVTLAWMTSWIRLKPLFAAETFFPAMLGLHHPFSTSDSAPHTVAYANAAAQDAFCANTYCWITTLYDQSGHKDDLTQAPRGLVPASKLGQGVTDVR